MSCSATRLVSYYSDKVNIYDSKSFIKLPNYRTCPPPSCILMAPPFHFPVKPGPVPPPVPPFNYPGAPPATGCSSCK